jgi:hypothetical protein
MADAAPHTALSPVFSGFDIPRQNWFKMPNAWTDITADITSLAELKVIEYVLKHTWGYREYGLTKHITTDEFMHGRRRKDGDRIDRGTGLSKPSVIAGLKSAIAHGYLEELVDDSDRARIKKFYSLKMAPGIAPDDDEDEPEQNPPLPPDEMSDPGGVKHLNADVKNLYIGGNILDIWGKESLHRSEKDTLERQQQTDTKNNNSVVAEDANHVVVAGLMAQGIGRTVARRLARLYPADYITRKQEYLEFLLANRPHELKKPAAWLRKAIEDDYGAPDGFVSPREAEIYAREEKRQNQALLEAQTREREQRAHAEELRAAAAAARQRLLHAQYGTTEDDLALWQAVRKDLSYGTGGVYALVATADILKVTGDKVILGIPQRGQFLQLQHPGYQSAIKRTFRQHTRQSLELELVLTAVEQGDDPPGRHPQ